MPRVFLGAWRPCDNLTTGAVRADCGVRAAHAALRALAAVLAVLTAVFVGFSAAVPSAWAEDEYSQQAPSPTMGSLPIGLEDVDPVFTTISRLSDADSTIDNQLVTFRGEVVGEPLKSSREGYCWVAMMTSIKGSTSDIAVLMPEEFLVLVNYWGDYKNRGTTLSVTGVYHVADLNQTGDLDVEAYVVRVVSSGGPVQETVDTTRIWIGLSLVAAGAILTLLNVYFKRRSRS